MVFTQLGYLRSSSFTLGFKPKSLIAAIWIHFLWEVLGVQKPRRCLICGTWFTGRSQAKTCGEQTLGSERRSACRTELYRRKKMAKELFLQGKEVHEVLQFLGEIGKKLPIEVLEQWYSENQKE
ncbi:MAG: hypothetical protein ACYC25_14815 [Paludibacter sp.]